MHLSLTRDLPVYFLKPENVGPQAVVNQRSSDEARIINIY